MNTVELISKELVGVTVEEYTSPMFGRQGPPKAVDCGTTYRMRTAGEESLTKTLAGRPSSNMGLDNCSSSCSSGVTARTTIPIPNCLGIGQALGRATPSIETVVLESACLF